MIRYRLKPIVREWDGEDLWVGALPDGPIGWVGGVGALVLDVLAEEAEGARSAMEIDSVLRQEIPGMPEDAHRTIAEFLDGLVVSGFVESVGGGSA